jgi:integrase
MSGHAFRPTGTTTWRARWDTADPSTGRRQQRSKGGFATKLEAETYAKAQTQTAKSAPVASVRTTLGEFLDLWLDGIQGELRASTFNWYAGHVRRHIAPSLGNRPLAEVTRAEVRAFYATLPPRTVERVHRTLRRALYEAVASDLIVRNPVAGMRRRQPWKDGRGLSVWTWDELSIFLRAADADTNSSGVWGPYFRLLAATGCRRGEGLGLWWSDIDLEQHAVRFQRALAEPGAILQQTKTAGSRRLVDVDEATADALASWRDRQGELRSEGGASWRPTVRLESGEERPNDTVFTRPDGRWILPCKASQAFRRISERAGLPQIRLHDLRHTHATLLLASGVNPKVISERLGHQGISITLDIYGHVLPTMGREAATLWAQNVGAGGAETGCSVGRQARPA